MTNEVLKSSMTNKTRIRITQVCGQDESPTCLDEYKEYIRYQCKSLFLMIFVRTESFFVINKLGFVSNVWKNPYILLQYSLFYWLD